MASNLSNNTKTDWSSYDWSKKGVNNKTDFNSYDWSKTKPTYVKTSLKDRLKGTPTKQLDNTYRANTGILPFLGGLPKASWDTAKSMVNGTINTGQTLGQSIATNTGAFDALNKANQQRDYLKLKLTQKIISGVKSGKDVSHLMKAYVGLVKTPKKTIQSLAPNTTKTNLQALGDIGFMASNVLMPGETAVGGETGKLLTRSAIESLIKSKTVSETERLMGKKLLYNLGTGYGFDVGNNLSEGKKGTKALKPGMATLLNAVFTGAEARGLLKTASKNEARILEERALNRANFGKIPDAGTPPPGYFSKRYKELPKPRKPEEIPIPMESEGIFKAQENLRNESNKSPIKTITEKKQKPEEIRAERFHSKQDFIENERAFYKRTKQKIPKGIEIKAGKAWDNAHLIPEEPKVKPSEITKTKIKQEVPVESAVKENIIKEPKITEEPVKVTEKEVKNGVQAIKDNLPDDVREHINLKEESKSANEYIKKNGVDNSIKALELGKTLPNDMRRDSLFSVLTNNKNLTGEQMSRLFDVKKNISSFSAQNLGLNRLQHPDSPFAAVQDVLNTLNEKKPHFLKVNEKIRTKSIARQIKQSIEKYRGDKSVIREALEALIC